MHPPEKAEEHTTYHYQMNCRENAVGNRRCGIKSICSYKELQLLYNKSLLVMDLDHLFYSKNTEWLFTCF
jgi:hypothetical protein